MTKKEKKLLNSIKYKDYQAITRMDKILTPVPNSLAEDIDASLCIEIQNNNQEDALSATFTDLAPELTHQIFEFLTGEEVVPLLITSKKCNETIIAGHVLFKDRIKQKYEDSLSEHNDFNRVNHAALVKLERINDDYSHDVGKNLKNVLRFLAAETIVMIVGMLMCRKDDKCTSDFYFRFLMALCFIAILAMGIGAVSSYNRYRDYIKEKKHHEKSHDDHQKNLDIAKCKLNSLKIMCEKLSLFSEHKKNNHAIKKETSTANESERISMPVSPYR